MGESNERLIPSARKEALIVEELPDEVLVYDLERHKAHCLNSTAAQVWKHCDGKKTVKELAHLIEKEWHTSAGEDLVWVALEQLEKVHLLQERLTRSTKMSRLPRRELVRKLGIAAVVAVPVITSIIAPTPAQAVSPGTTTAPVACTTSADCNMAAGETCSNGYCTSSGGSGSTG